MMLARFVLGGVLGLAVLSSAWAVEGVAPDGKFNPAEGVGTPKFGESIEQRDTQRRQASGEEGESHVDVLPGAAEGDRQDPALPPEVTPVRREATAGQRAEEPAVVPVERVERPPEREAERSSIPVGTAGDDGNLDAIVAALIEAINREPDIRRIGYASGEQERSGGEGREAVEPAKGPLPRVAAGDAFYARMMHAVNSDYPGPVLIELLQPPLAGAVARGEFQLVRERMVIRIASLDVAGETVPVDAVAVGLDCACFGVAGDVSYHWWDRVLLPAATGFVEQYLIARAQPERRVVTVDGGTVVTEESARSARQARDAGIAAAVGRVGQVLLEQAPSRQTVEIPRNAEVAVMFAARLQRASPAPAAESPVREPAPPTVERVRRTTGDGGEPR